MNKQEVFDKVAKHLLTQNARSLSGTGMCAYRGCDGLMCAVGVLITNENYSSDIEGCGVLNYKVETALESSGVERSASMESMLLQLQTIHDHREPDDWHAELKATAAHYNLEWNHEA